MEVYLRRILLRYKLISKSDSVVRYYNENHLSSAIHAAMEYGYKIVDMATGKVIKDFCRKPKHERLKDNAKIEADHKKYANLKSGIIDRIDGTSQNNLENLKMVKKYAK